MAQRSDYAFPFRIDSARQARTVGYEQHVAQLIRQLLLTAQGERENLPEFGCGLRNLVFAGNSDSLATMTQMLVQQALVRWLSDHLIVQRVEVVPEESRLLVRVEYVLVATRAQQSVEVLVA